MKSLLADYPDLPELTMMDDMPAANAETLAWLEEEALLGGEPSYDATTSSSSLPRAVELAMQAAGAGRPEAGIELLTREISRESYGRGRFQRKIQLARLLMAAENDAMAISMLQQAAAEIEEKKLEEWESGETLAAPLALLYSCLDKIRRRFGRARQIIFLDLPAGSAGSHEAGKIAYAALGAGTHSHAVGIGAAHRP